MKIEFLYFDDCASWKPALNNLREVVESINGKPIQIELIQVEADEEAQQQRFTGSPTMRIDGKDLFPPGHEDYALGCRVYMTPSGLRGWPTVEMIREALLVFKE